MTNPSLNSFFTGLALAQTLSDKLTETLTQGLSELGKFDALQQEKFHEFTKEVMVRAESANSQGIGNNNTINNVDMQELIDDLRAEIARLRSELIRYQQSQST
jgi:hypothetical protein